MLLCLFVQLVVNKNQLALETILLALAQRKEDVGLSGDGARAVGNWQARALEKSRAE